MRCWSFTGPGVWITACGVVHAETEEEARNLVLAALMMVTRVDDPQAITVTELETTEAAAYILFNGDM